MVLALRMRRNFFYRTYIYSFLTGHPFQPLALAPLQGAAEGYLASLFENTIYSFLTYRTLTGRSWLLILGVKPFRQGEAEAYLVSMFENTKNI